jgi:hypothetical protein
MIESNSITSIRYVRKTVIIRSSERQYVIFSDQSIDRIKGRKNKKKKHRIEISKWSCLMMQITWLFYPLVYTRSAHIICVHFLTSVYSYLLFVHSLFQRFPISSNLVKIQIDSRIGYEHTVTSRIVRTVREEGRHLSKNRTNGYDV